MKCLLVLAAFVTLSVLADKPGEVSPYPPSKMAEFNAKTGGLIEPPADLKRLVVLDGREKDLSQLTNHLAAVQTQLGIGAQIRKVKLNPTADLWNEACVAKTTGAGAVVILYEREGAPVLSTFPEDAITLLNVLPLQKGVEYTPYRWRLVKEFWRAIAFAIGGYGNMTQLNGCLQPVFSLADLDALRGWNLTPPQITSIAMNKGRLKLYNPKPVPYSRACREGWAPAPTNSAQRALYQRLKDPTSRFKSDFSK